jgi:hypothetical protein
MPKRKPDPNCCLCGLPYERIGNNPAPLAQKGRCCDACNEVVIGARIDPKGALAEVSRIEAALLRINSAPLREIAIAAMCAAHGPDLWAMRKGGRALLRERIEAHEHDGE